MVSDMGIYTNIGLVEHAKATLGTNYVYGMKNTIMTQANYTYLFNTYGSSNVWESDKSKVGTVCVDCSGLISSYTEFPRNSAGYKSSAAVVHDISTIDDAPIGAAVWRSGHIGVYIGGGEIIEARGSAYGVVQTPVVERDFTHWFYLTDIIYTEEEYEVENITVSVDNKEIELEGVFVEGTNYVKLRDLADILGVEVGYDDVKKIPYIITK